MYLPLKKNLKNDPTPFTWTGLFKSNKFIQELRSAPSWKIFKFELFNQVLLKSVCHSVCHSNNAALGHH